MLPPEANPSERRWGRWMLPAAGFVVLATSLTGLFVARVTSDACAAVGSPATTGQRPVMARPLLAAEKSGKATYYAVDGRGNCSFDPAGPGNYVAVGPSEYAAGAACGSYLDVVGPKGTVRAKVTDQCPGCTPGHIDLSEEAFAAVGDLSDGVVTVTYRQVADPVLSEPLALRFQDGVSEYWLAVRFDHHGNPLASVEVKAGDAWLPLARSEDNYWARPQGAGPGPYSFRLLDDQGHQAIIEGIELASDRLLRTSTWMYGGPSALPTGPSAPAGPAAGSPLTGSAGASSPVTGAGTSRPVGGRPTPTPSRSHRCA